jgi:exopolysaccharide biosynthesis polyprenyl glycosylphosphotransferase
MQTLDRAGLRTAREAEAARRVAPSGAQAPTGPGRPVAPSGRALRRRLIAADALAVAIGLTLAFVWQALVRSPDELGVQCSHLLVAFATFPVWLLALAAKKLYQARAIDRPVEELRRLVGAGFVSIGVIVGIAFVGKFETLSRLWVAATLVLVVASLCVERTIARRVRHRMRRRGLLARRILIVGTDPEAIGLMHAAQRRPEVGYRPVGFVGPDDIGERGGCSHLGDLDQVWAALNATGATGVVISLASVAPETVNRMTRQLTDAGYHVALSSGLRDIDLVRFRAQDLDGRTLLYVEQTRRDGWRAFAKRIFDVTVAVLALVLSAPITIAAALALKLTSPGPVLFAQERVGQDGRPFRIYKFRTMVADAEARKAELAAFNEADGPMFKVAKDPRITRVGAILRKLSIDEVPQFINVLKGEMSVVGPRPALASEVAQWTDDVHDRLRVLPGITGMWQVSGRSDTSFDEYKRLDLYYVDNWSLVHDLRIVLRTFGVVVAQSGAR